MPSRKMEAQLEALAALRRTNVGDEATVLLRKSLADGASLVIAKAADITGERQIRELVPDLLKAYGCLWERGAKRDPQCWAKIAIAKALKDLDYSTSEPFVRALTYQQWEPVWGSEIDTAGPLRAICFMAIVQCNDLMRDEKLLHLVRGLADTDTTVRLDVARTLEQIEGREAVLLLRLKARMRDKEASVTGQVLASLLCVEGPEAIPFVTEFLWQQGEPEPDEELAEHAALALGASRLPAAIDALIACWKDSSSGRVNSAVFLRAISVSRQQQALEFLLDVVRRGRQHEAKEALEALGLHGESEHIRARVRAAVDQRDSIEVHSAFRQAFG